MVEQKFTQAFQSLVSKFLNQAVSKNCNNVVFIAASFMKLRKLILKFTTIFGLQIRAWPFCEKSLRLLNTLLFLIMSLSFSLWWQFILHKCSKAITCFPNWGSKLQPRMPNCFFIPKIQRYVTPNQKYNDHNNPWYVEYGHTLLFIFAL